MFERLDSCFVSCADDSVIEQPVLKCVEQDILASHGYDMEWY